MLGIIAGAALKVAGQVAGGIANAKKRAEQRRMLQEQQKENQAWFDRNYYADPTQRVDVQRMLTQMNETIKNRNKAAKGRQAVMGGTEDSTTAVKEANNKTVADATGQIVAQNEARKDKVEEQYMQNKRQIQGQQMQMKADEAGQTAAAISGLAGTAANIAGAIGGGGDNSGGGKMAPDNVRAEAGSNTDLSNLDAKVGMGKSPQDVASDLKDMIGDNAPKA